MSLPSPQIHDSTFNFVGHDQIIQNIYHVYTQGSEPGPASPINDSPMGRLSVHFTGRGKGVDFLQNALSKTQNGVPSCCAVFGMPGDGKSQLILHYAKLSFDRGQYSYIFWISATTTDKLNDGLAKILDLVRHPDRGRKLHNLHVKQACPACKSPESSKCVYSKSGSRPSHLSQHRTPWT